MAYVGVMCVKLKHCLFGSLVPVVCNLTDFDNLTRPKVIIFYGAGLSFIITLVPYTEVIWCKSLVMLLLCFGQWYVIMLFNNNRKVNELNILYIIISSCLKRGSHIFDCWCTFSLYVTIITHLPNCETFAFIAVYYMDSPMMSMYENFHFKH